MANEAFTQLPVVANATLNDIICAVQGGVSVQETLSQVYSIFAGTLVSSFAGDPNGSVAGTQYKNFVWDTSSSILYICVTTGTSSTAVWQTVAPTATFNWSVISVTSAAMVGNNGYITNNGSLITLTLPTTSAVGQVFRIVGLGAGGWQIAQNVGQNIQYGNQATTVGGAGALSSTNANDTVELVTTVANTQFTVVSTQGNLTYI